MSKSMEKLKLIRSKLQNILPLTFTLYPNGILNALDFESKSKEETLSKLKLLEIIENLSISEYSFNDKDNIYLVQGKIDLDKLDEDIKINDKLNPKLWDSNNELLPEIRDKILKIVDLFKNQLKEDGVDLFVDDIYLLGSNANYNYTEQSDLDIHIIADESFDCAAKHLDIIYNAYKTLFNKKYDIDFNGIDVEIYVENKDKLTSVTSGLYSLKNGWIKNPSKYEIPEIDEPALDKLVAEWEDKYLKLIENSPTIDDILDYVNDIYALRQKALETDGEFGLGNLAFKEIRRLGYLENLKDIRDSILSKSLSL